MITEVMKVTIDPDAAAEFEAAVADCAQVFRTAEGCHGISLEREIENPAHYYLRVKWDSVEAHQTIRGTEGALRWRDQVGAFYEYPVSTVHVEEATSYF